jgi:hypothetical protein
MSVTQKRKNCIFSPGSQSEEKTGTKGRKWSNERRLRLWSLEVENQTSKKKKSSCGAPRAGFAFAKATGVA